MSLVLSGDLLAFCFPSCRLDAVMRSPYRTKDWWVILVVILPSSLVHVELWLRQHRLWLLVSITGSRQSTAFLVTLALSLLRLSLTLIVSLSLGLLIPSLSFLVSLALSLVLSQLTSLLFRRRIRKGSPNLLGRHC